MKLQKQSGWDVGVGGVGGAGGGVTKNGTSGSGAAGFIRITYTATRRVFITEYSHK